MALVLGLLLGACGLTPKKVAYVSIGNTGCPPDDLALFNFVKETRSWNAACGTKLYVCSDVSGGTRCTEQDPETVDKELADRAAILLTVPKQIRDRFITMNIMKGSWDDYTRDVMGRSKLTDNQFDKVGSDGRLYTTFSKDFNKKLRACLGNGVLKVRCVGNDKCFLQVVGEPFCTGLLGSDDVKPLRVSGAVAYLVADVFGIEAVPRPEPPPDPAPEEGAEDEAEEVAATSEPEPAIAGENSELESEVRNWLDGGKEAILGCAGKDSVAVQVSVDGDGVATLKLRGDLASSPEEKCARTAVGEKSFSAGPAEVVHFVKR